MAEHGVEFASVGVYFDQLQKLAPPHHQLLLLAAGKVAMDTLDDASGSLQGQRVQEHGVNSVCRLEKMVSPDEICI